VNGKLISKYIRDDNLPKIRDELDKRAKLKSKTNEIDDKLDKIEAAASILDSSLRRYLATLRRCAAMEAMTLVERSKSLAFGGAMAALEGIRASEETEANLACWAIGDFSFQDSYLNTLRAYHLMD
jgi:hypothetical protein